MKSVAFRPLRRVKKTGKIVVAAYAKWNSVRTADYSTFSLTIDREYAELPDDELVYNHKGENLFWLDFDPDSIPMLSGAHSHEEWQVFKAVHAGRWAIRYPASEWWPNESITYCVTGLDCQGTPTFSHRTADDVAEHRSDFHKYEPLTVGVVKKWYGWWLTQLQNAQLSY